METIYPIKIQAICSKGRAERFYAGIPQALAAAIGLQAGETVQWELLDRGELHLIRCQTPPPTARRRAVKNPL
jgi:hypothetical protein